MNPFTFLKGRSWREPIDHRLARRVLYVLADKFKLPHLEVKLVSKEHPTCYLVGGATICIESVTTLAAVAHEFAHHVNYVRDRANGITSIAHGDSFYRRLDLVSRAMGIGPYPWNCEYEWLQERRDRRQQLQRTNATRQQFKLGAIQMREEASQDPRQLAGSGILKA